jgi:hypothetical protein
MNLGATSESSNLYNSPTSIHTFLIQDSQILIFSGPWTLCLLYGTSCSAGVGKRGLLKIVRTVGFSCR